MHAWQKSILAVVALVGAAGMGAALHVEKSADQRMTLNAVEAPASDGHYSFAIRATPVAGLYPGADRRLVLTLDNPYPFALVVTDMRARLVSTSNPGCAPVSTNLELRPYTGRLPLSVAADDSHAGGTVPLHMPNSVVDACQAATFTIALDADATRATA